MKRILLIVLLLAGLNARAYDYTWQADAAGLVSTENGRESVGYLWVADTLRPVNAVMFAFQNMNEETLFTLPAFRQRMASLGVGLLWIAPGFGQEWDVYTGCQDAFNRLLDSLATVSRHPEIATVPLIPFGHSAQATMPWNFAAWNPQRTLCLISYHGDSPRTNLCGYGRSNIEWGRTRNIDGIPSLMVMGEYEWWTARLLPAIGFKTMYPGSCVSFLADVGRGHFDVADRTADYIATFVEKAWQLRQGAKLVPLDPTDGWRAQWWLPSVDKREKAAPWHQYKGCQYEAFWYPDAEMALLTEEIYRQGRGGKMSWIGFAGTDGSLLTYNPNGHCKMTARVKADADGVFGLKAVFTDSLRTALSAERPLSDLRLRYVSGPAVQLTDSTFRVLTDHPTWVNPRRRAKVTIVAEAPRTPKYKETVQEIEVTLLP